MPHPPAGAPVSSAIEPLAERRERPAAVGGRRLAPFQRPAQARLGAQRAGQRQAERPGHLGGLEPAGRRAAHDHATASAQCGATAAATRAAAAVARSSAGTTR